MDTFRVIYDAAFSIVFKVAYSIVHSEEAAEELCQETFLKLYERNMLFPNIDEAKYWLIRVVKNAALNYAKRKGRERNAYQKFFHETTFRQGETGEALLGKKETISEIQGALNKLPEHLRIVMILKEYTELNYKEIGRMLGISEGNVKIRVFRARERLMVLLSPLRERRI